MAENPGTEKVGNLLKHVDNGSYVIPYFQRGFEWQPSMVCDLFESILQNYFTGLILFWDLNIKEVEHEKWDPVWGAELQAPPQKAILDGQQRLSSLYYAIYNPKKLFPNRWSYYLFFLNLNKALNGEFEELLTYKFYSSYQTWDELRKNRGEWIDSGNVPISILSAKDPIDNKQDYLDSKEFEDWQNEYISSNKSLLPSNITSHKVYKQINSILNYTFVYFPLDSDRDLHDICNIFARVNAKGMKLSTFDLMNAFLYPKDIMLRKDLWDNLENDVLKSIDSNMNEYLLKIISLHKQNYCSSKYIYNLIPGEKTLRKDSLGKSYKEIFIKNGQEFKKLWKSACKYADESRQTIMNTGYSDFGAIKTDFIPNTTLVPVLAAILWEKKGSKESKKFKDVLKRWYWSVVLSEDYSGASDSVMAKDFRDWKDWMNNNGKIERINKVSAGYVNEIDFKNVKKGSSRYNAVISLLALSDVKDFFKGRIVGTGDYSNDKINDHHIFPKQINKLHSTKSRFFKDARDSILNRTLLLDETNIRISNKMPSKYLNDMIDKNGSEKKVKSILKEHFISGKAYEYMKDNDFDNFIKERERIIKYHIKKVLLNKQ